MKKLIFPLLLMLAIGMLAAVESDPSNVVGYVKYPLHVGNNDIAVPMDQGYTNASHVGNDIPGCGTVKYYDGENQVWMSADKAPFPPNPWIPLDFAVTGGDPLFINTTTAGDFFSIGGLPDLLANYTLHVGNNYIMVPLDKSDLTSASLVGNSIPGCGTVKYYDGQNQVWMSADKAPFPPNPWIPVDFDVAIGDALLINTTAAGTWPGLPATKFSK